MRFKGVEICCPHCRGEFDRVSEDASELHCTACQRSFPILHGIPDLRIFPDPYIDIQSDRDKGKQVAARFEELSFEELVAYYYSQTPVVPPHHARQYTRGILAGVARSRAALDYWETFSTSNETAPGGSLLDLGCGTGPLLVAAAPRFDQLVGIDIAFRWLIIAKKRLAEAELDMPLICACAEALPFPDRSFDRVAAESVIEHVKDQALTLTECRRVLHSQGYLYLSTPNRLSLGPDPQAGILAGGYLPERWLAAIIRRQGGIPPKRALLSAQSLRSRLQRANFDSPWIGIPDIPAGQREHFGFILRGAIAIYHLVKRIPGGQKLLIRIGPTLYAVTRKLRANA